MKIRIFINQTETAIAINNGFKGKVVLVFNNNFKNHFHQRILCAPPLFVIEDSRGSNHEN